MILTGDASSEFAAIAMLNNWSASFEHLVNTDAYDKLSHLIQLSINIYYIYSQLINFDTADWVSEKAPSL